jgi:hypothetical protein
MMTPTDFPRPHGVVQAEMERAREAGTSHVTVEPTLDEALGMSVMGNGRLIPMRDCSTEGLEAASKVWLRVTRSDAGVSDAYRMSAWRYYRAARLVIDSREDFI